MAQLEVAADPVAEGAAVAVLASLTQGAGGCQWFVCLFARLHACWSGHLSACL